MNHHSEIRGYIFDLDGTFYVGDKAIEGAADLIVCLRDKNIPFRFTTNTTTRSLDSLIEKLNRLGLTIRPEESFGAVKAAVEFLRSKGNPSCFLVLAEEVLTDFAEFQVSDRSPDYIILGDIDYWNYDLLNRLFGMIMNGATLVALHKGRYWQTESGLQLDIGLFVAGLEYVTDRKAIVIGKPSQSLFQLVLDDMNLPAGQVAMVGDDIINDVKGAQEAGMKGILVKTGKYREDLVAESNVKPDMVIDSVAELLHGSS